MLPTPYLKIMVFHSEKNQADGLKDGGKNLLDFQTFFVSPAPADPYIKPWRGAAGAECADEGFIAGKST